MLWTICSDCNIWINSLLKYSVCVYICRHIYIYIYCIICKLQVGLDLFLTKTFIGEGVWGTFVGNFVDAILKKDPGNCSEHPGRAQVHPKHACYRWAERCIYIYIHVIYIILLYHQKFTKNLSAQKLSKPPTRLMTFRLKKDKRISGSTKPSTSLRGLNAGQVTKDL